MMNNLDWTVGVGAGVVAGGIAGSFLGALAVRWPAGRSIARGRSCCDGCGAPVAWRHLIPVLSFLLLRGRCARCAAPIDRRQPLMEGVCAALGGVALWLRPDAAGVAGAVFGWLLAVLALLDRDHFWLPDRLTVTVALAGLVGGLAGMEPPLADRLAGGISGWAALALLAFVYRRTRGREGLGQGDAKLLGAIGLWLGWRVLPWVVLGASLLGLGWVTVLRLGGRSIFRTDALPLGTLLALAAWPAWGALAYSS